MNLCKYYVCYDCFIHADKMNICGECPCTKCIRRCKKAKGKRGFGKDYYQPP